VYDHNKGIKVAQNVAEIEGETSAADLIIVETSFGRVGTNCGKNKDENYPEKIEVWGRECEKQKWIKLGEYCRNAFVDIMPVIEAGQRYVKFLKLVDISDKALFEDGDDGYDVDGIIACPATVIAAITGEGRNPIVHGRTETNFVFDRNFVNLAPNASIKNSFSIKAYPNPTQQQVNLEIQHSNNFTNVEVHIFNVIGVLVGKQSINNTNLSSMSKISVDIGHYESGMYILQLVTPNGSVSKSVKIIKQ
jgi:hypothetical protein